MKTRFLRGCLNKCKNCRSCPLLWPNSNSNSSSSSMNNGSCKKKIPRDVPKGHLVVYVGESLKRYVIKVAILHHPLFRALLDQAQEEYDFIAGSKLCIPCDEHIFLGVVRCANSPQDEPVCLCL